MLDQTYSQEFEVEQIIDEKKIDGETYFLVKWIGYGHEENTWEPQRHMTNSKQKLNQWEKYKLKQVSLLQNYKLLEDLDLQTDKNKISLQSNAEFIEAARKSSTPYKKFKPMILFDSKDQLSSPEDGKITSLFDRPEVKKIIKRKKIERKKKDLEIFEQRLKSRPKVWEKYIQNQDEAIKLANQKIKEVVDQVFGLKRDSTQNPDPNNKKERVQQKRNLPKKQKSKVFQIFSDSDELEMKKEPNHGQEKILNLRESLDKPSYKKNDSSSQIDESTNFFSKKQAPISIQNQSTKTRQKNFSSPPLKDCSSKCDKQLEKKQKMPSLFPKKNFSIQPETIRLDISMIQRLTNKKSLSFETDESSSSNDLESDCASQILPKKSSSSSSSDSSGHFNNLQGSPIQEENASKNEQNAQTAGQKSESNYPQNPQKIIEENIQNQSIPKVENDKLSDEKMKFQLENLSTNIVKFIPFECSISTIEGIQTSDQLAYENSKTNPSQFQQIQKLQSSINRGQNENNQDRIINYSSLTNHRSTALPSSDDSSQNYHVFTTQNAYQQNFLQNRSLSTRASFNTYKTESELANLNTQPNDNIRQDREKSHIGNLDRQQKTSNHIFSSSSSYQILDKLNFTQIKKESSNTKISKSLSLEYLLRKINSKSSNLSNLAPENQNSRQNQQKNNPCVGLISIDHEKSQEFPNQPIQTVEKLALSQNENLSDESSKILLDLNKIGSENQGKSSKKTSKKSRSIIVYSLPINETCPEMKEFLMNQANDMSSFHQMFILENNLPEEFA